MKPDGGYEPVRVPTGNILPLDVESSLFALGYLLWLVAFALILMPGLYRRFTGRLRVVT